jgi:hypothetical protein
MATATGIAAPVAYARFAGLCYLAIFVLAIYANFSIFGQLIVSGDPAASADNISENMSRFRLGVGLFLAVLVFDVLIAWSLYLVMKPVNANLSLLSAIFHLVYTAAHVGVVLNLVAAIDIAIAPETYAAMEPALKQVFTYHFLASHESGFTVTLIFFGVHLLVLGYLIVKSTYLPSAIGVLIAVAGAGYLIDGFGTVLFGDYDGEASLGLYIVILPALIGEGALILWLCIRGVNRQKWLETAG